jgi:hypothetical protein
MLRLLGFACNTFLDAITYKHAGLAEGDPPRDPVSVGTPVRGLAGWQLSGAQVSQPGSSDVCASPKPS